MQAAPHAEYYQALADVIAVFWQFHKARLADGNIAWGYESVREGAAITYKPYENPEVSLQRHATFDVGIDKDILGRFSVAGRMAMEASWRQFLAAAGAISRSTIGLTDRSPALLDLLLFLDSERLSPNEAYQKFTGPFTHELLQRAKQLERGTQVQTQAGVRLDMGAAVGAGMGTGFAVTTNLLALMGDHFKPITPLLMSRIAIGKLPELNRQIKAGKQGVSTDVIAPGTTSDANVEQLRSMGLGRAVGCPAGLPASVETRRFLESLGITNSERLMLVDFASVMETEFNRTVQTWFDALPEERHRGVEVAMGQEVVEMLTGRQYERLAEAHAAKDAAVRNGEFDEIDYTEPKAPSELSRRNKLK